MKAQLYSDCELRMHAQIQNGDDLYVASALAIVLHARPILCVHL